MTNTGHVDVCAKHSMHRVPAADGTLLAVHVFASVQDHRQLAAARDQRQLMLLHANGFSGRCYAELVRLVPGVARGAL